MLTNRINDSITSFNHTKNCVYDAGNKYAISHSAIQGCDSQSYFCILLFFSSSSFIHIFPGVNNLSLIQVSFLFSVVLINIQRMISQEKAQKEFDESFVSLNYQVFMIESYEILVTDGVVQDRYFLDETKRHKRDTSLADPC